MLRRKTYPHCNSRNTRCENLLGQRILIYIKFEDTDSVSSFFLLIEKNTSHLLELFRLDAAGEKIVVALLVEIRAFHILEYD